MFKGNPVKLSGELPANGKPAPGFKAVANDLSEVDLSKFKGKTLIISAVPSLDTGVCDKETRRFNEEAGKLGDNVAILTISNDLPFAQKRWCGAAGVDKVQVVSDFRDHAFGKAYGIEQSDGPLRGLLARAVVVVGKDGTIKYSQLVPEITTEPDYAKILDAAKQA